MSALARSRLAVGAAIFLLALSVRVVVTRVCGDRLDALPITGRQLDVARNVLEGRGLVVDYASLNSYVATCERAGRLLPYDPPPSRGPLVPEYQQDPGLAFALVVLWRATGSRDPMLLAYAQSVLDALAAVLVLLAATRLYSTRIGAVAAVAYALFPPRVLAVSTPCFYVYPGYAAVVGLATLAFVSREDRRSWQRDAELFVAAGVAIGLLHWVRSVVALFTLALAVGVLFRTRSARRAALATLCLVGAHALVIAPIVARNHARFGTWRPTRGVFWHMAWVGLGQFDNPYGCEDKDAKAIAFIVGKYGGGLDDPGYERHMKDEVLAIAKRDPGIFARNAVARFAWLTPYDPKLGLRWSTRLEAPFYGPPLYLAGALEVALLFLIPLALLEAGAWHVLAPSLIPAAYFVVTLVPYYYQPQYVEPSVLVLLVPLAGLLANGGFSEKVRIVAALPIAHGVARALGALAAALTAHPALVAAPLDAAGAFVLGTRTRTRFERAGLALLLPAAVRVARQEPLVWLSVLAAFVAGCVKAERTRPPV